MNYDLNQFTYGVELEFGNCNTETALPDGAKWNHLDNTCVSSTGIANDPLCKLYKFGGEINTRPTGTIQEQIKHIEKILTAVPESIVNYRSNLHIHVRVPGLSEDLDMCKRLLRYVDTYQQEAFDIVETIPAPDPRFMKPEVFKWAQKRYVRRNKSHQYCLPKSRVEAMLKATTVKEFYEEHAPLTEKGRMWFFSPRAGINLRQMWEETNTIEFRHFPGTLDMKEMANSISWCCKFLDAALNYDDIRPSDIKTSPDCRFPDFMPYEYETEQCYQATNFDSNNRKEVSALLDYLRSKIDIDDMSTPSTEVLPYIREFQKK